MLAPLTTSAARALNTGNARVRVLPLLVLSGRGRLRPSRCVHRVRVTHVQYELGDRRSPEVTTCRAFVFVVWYLETLRKQKLGIRH